MENDSDAVAWYRGALDLLPIPAKQWEAATWIFSAIGDAHFLSVQPGPALESLDAAIESPGGFENPFLHLRRGQALFDLARREEATN